MGEAGLNYLIASIPRHSILFLITNDGQVEWRDMLMPKFDENLTNEMIVGKSKDGAPLNVADIVAFSRRPTPEGLMFDKVYNPKYEEAMYSMDDKHRQYMTLLEPGYGQKIQILQNIAIALRGMGDDALYPDTQKNTICKHPRHCVKPLR